MGRKIAYLDCHSGISGNMFLGAMLDAGFTLDRLKEALSGLPIAGYEFDYHPVEVQGIRGTYFDVVLSGEAQPTRHLSDIIAILEGGDLSERVRDLASQIFRRLAEAEAKVHDTAVEAVHFHEVGAVDAIIDIVGAALAYETLGIEQLYASPLPLTSGHVKTAHGLLPIPAPATLEILRQVEARWKPCPIEGELVTPTGAAILATLARFETPDIKIGTVGYGFGKKRLPWPNCLRLCLGTTSEPIVSDMNSGELEMDQVTIIESNIDNMSGELIGALMERLLSAGALDVTYTPIQMKKNRPAVMVTVISPVESADALSRLLLRETTTLGVRMGEMRRLKARREQVEVETPFGPIQAKVKRLGDEVISASPEYEDCQRIANERNLPLPEVYDVLRGAIGQRFKLT
jgi:uncharacterized protein (TIGR00299 family) protein